MYKLLVICCPRSGARFTAEALLSIGFKMGHEKEGAFGMVDWHMATKDASEYKHIFHQVRHPVDCISSMAQVMRDNSYEHIQKELKLDTDDRLLIAMHMWLEWNKICEERAQFTYRLEDFVALFPRRGRMNARPHDKIEWGDIKRKDLLLAAQISDLANHYGYHL